VAHILGEMKNWLTKNFGRKTKKKENLSGFIFVRGQKDKKKTVLRKM
jgi:hypothetical protein